MNRRLTLMLIAAGLCGAAAQAAQPVLTSAEKARARALPHYATAGFELDGGVVVYGALVIQAFDDGPARVEFRGSSGATSGFVAGSFDLAAPEVEGGTLRAVTAVEAGGKGLYRNHGSLSVAAGEAASIVDSSLRVDQDGLFALDVVGRDLSGATRSVRAFGRVVGTCWTVRNDTVRRVADLGKRPDCMRLFGGL
jgi:hypothetical protein